MTTHGTDTNTLISYDRIETLDIIRGFTLFGILIANLLLGYSGYLLLSPELIHSFPTAPIDQIIVFFKNIFVEGKFYSIFSFLFGVGFGLQLTRTDKTNPNFFKIYRRRLFILLIIGIIHMLFWRGDILTLYALLGFVLILFHNKSPRFIFTCAIISFCIPLIIDFIRYGIYLYDNKDIFGFLFSGRNQFIQNSIIVNAKGSFAEIFIVNFKAIKYRWVEIFITNRIFRVLGMFLIGLYTAKTHLFTHIDQQKNFIKKIIILGLVIGLPLNLFYAILSISPPIGPDYHWLLKMICYTFGAPLLALCYAGIITLLSYKKTQAKTFILLANVGKMALTNYLSQTLIGLLIFYHYGLDLFGQVSASTCLVLALLIFTGQIIFSNLWLQFFNFGPVEWLWRSLTYKKWFPLMKS